MKLYDLMNSKDEVGYSWVCIHYDLSPRYCPDYLEELLADMHDRRKGPDAVVRRRIGMNRKTQMYYYFLRIGVPEIFA